MIIFIRSPSAIQYSLRAHTREQKSECEFLQNYVERGVLKGQLPKGFQTQFLHGCNGPAFRRGVAMRASCVATQTMAHEAATMLHTMNFVGITDFYTETVCSFHEHFGATNAWK